jgi:ubiquinone/menaquinone biosynthesis C-methylase UbiE
MAEIANLYDDGNAYERMMGRWSAIAGEKFLDWLDLPKGLRWLDVGCGNGSFTEVLIAGRAPNEVTAVDPSEEQLAFARSRPGTAMAQFRTGVAEALPLADQSFDVAAMALVLSLLRDPIKVAAEMARVVRPHGWVATYMWDIPGGGLPTEPIYAGMRSLGLDPTFGPGAPASARDEMQRTWEAAGLTHIETCVLSVPIVYSSFEDFWEANDVPIGPSGNALRAMRPEIKAQLKSAVRKLVPTNPDGQVYFEALANAVKGKVANVAGRNQTD